MAVICNVSNDMYLAKFKKSYTVHKVKLEVHTATHEHRQCTTQINITV